MKKIFMALLAMSFSLPAFAEWVSYHRNADVEEFYDNKFVSRDGGVIRLWTMSDYAKPITSLEGQELLSEKFFTTVDCTSRKTGSEKVMKYAGHRADGKLLATMDTVLRLTNIRQGSSDEVLMDRICR
jgi:hypothetical protein